jgi:hypothetical protein
VVLLPIDLNVTGEVKEAANILNHTVKDKLINRLKAARLVHFGTPCTTMLKAQKNDGGPTPLRLSSMIEGFMEATSRGHGGLTDA